MTLSVTRADHGHVPTEAHSGRRVAIASLLMAPAIAVLYVPLYLVGSAFQNALGLAEDELLVEAGAWGVAAFLLMVFLVAVPQIVGIVLGVKARRLGERRLGTAGVVVNAVIGVYLLLSSVVQALFA